MTKSWEREQRMITSNIRTQIEQTEEHEHSTPLYMTSSFVFDDAEHMRALFAEEQQGNIYSRFTNPNTTEFVDKMVAMEGAEAGVATSTGMAAGFASIMGLLQESHDRGKSSSHPSRCGNTGLCSLHRHHLVYKLRGVRIRKP